MESSEQSSHAFAESSQNRNLAIARAVEMVGFSHANVFTRTAASEAVEHAELNMLLREEKKLPIKA